MDIRLIFNKINYPVVILLVVVGMGISPVLQANQDDWVLVDRFKRQLASANNGKVKAMYAVGKLYERGRGVKRDLSKAAEWYKKAADAGQTSAQSRLGIMYFEGRGVDQDYRKALSMLNRAAKDNVPSALYQLANMYELGTGVSQDINKAIYWYEKADKYGYYLAEGKISRLQKLLRSVKQDPAPKRVERKTVNTSPAKPKTSPLLAAVLSGKWIKRSKPVGYLPSSITKCINASSSKLTCISTSQERSTGDEIITYNTESTVSVNGRNKFTVSYVNNVLEVELLNKENGDGEVIESSISRIKKGKKGKKRQLTCLMNDSNLINCAKKGRNAFELYSQ